MNLAPEVLPTAMAWLLLPTVPGEWRLATPRLSLLALTLAVLALHLPVRPAGADLSGRPRTGVRR